jgi:hypothetical protein
MNIFKHGSTIGGFVCAAIIMNMQAGFAATTAVNGALVDLAAFVSRGAVHAMPGFASMPNSQAVAHSHVHPPEEESEAMNPAGMPMRPMPMGSAAMGTHGMMPMMGPEMMAAMMAKHRCGPLAIVVPNNGKSYVVVSKTPASQPILCASVGKNVNVTGELYERSGISLIVADSVNVGL